jgi:hypothetical protein
VPAAKFDLVAREAEHPLDVWLRGFHVQVFFFVFLSRMLRIVIQPSIGRVKRNEAGILTCRVGKFAAGPVPLGTLRSRRVGSGGPGRILITTSRSSLDGGVVDSL